MDDTTLMAARQLDRMRGMTLEYHRRFFSDVRMVLLVTVALFVVGFWGVTAAFLLVPVVALYGAVQTAFDASYLIFARHYAARLERLLDARTGSSIHVGAALEDTYLFPLDETKIVTAAIGPGFSWFGFVTLFYTALGAASAGFGIALGWSLHLGQQPAIWRFAYVATLGILGAAAVGAGLWWFVGGEGERRLGGVLDGYPTR